MLFSQTWDTALAKRNRHSPALQGKAKGRMRTDNTQWQRPCEESGHSGGNPPFQRMEKTEIRPHGAHDKEQTLCEGVRRADTGGLGRPPTPAGRPPPAELGLLGGKGRTRTAENSEEPQGPRERGYEVGPHGAALLGAPRALGTGGGRSVTGGCGGTGLSRVCGGKPPQAEACEDWGSGGRPPPRLKGSRRGARRKGPRPGAGGRRRLTPPHGEGAVPARSSRQTAGGRAAEAPTHPPEPDPRSPSPRPPGEGLLTGAAGAGSGDRLCSAAPPSAQAPGGGRGAGRSRARPLPPHDSRETPPGPSTALPLVPPQRRPLTARTRLSPNHKAAHRPPSNHKFLPSPTLVPHLCQPMEGRPTSAPRLPPALAWRRAGGSGWCWGQGVSFFPSFPSFPPGGSPWGNV